MKVGNRKGIPHLLYGLHWQVQISMTTNKRCSIFGEMELEQKQNNNKQPKHKYIKIFLTTLYTGPYILNQCLPNKYLKQSDMFCFGLNEATVLSYLRWVVFLYYKSEPIEINDRFPLASKTTRLIACYQRNCFTCSVHLSLPHLCIVEALAN